MPLKLLQACKAGSLPTGEYMTCKISVVIPYYQEEPGILRGAVTSALAQQGVTDLEIIVVDDGSPAPACHDLERLDIPSHVSLKLIEQPNRGPGAARNCALDAVSSDTTYVAFLDSDDQWIPNHLSSSQSALGEHYDLYFSDVRMTKAKASRFARQGMKLYQHVCIDSVQRWHEFRLGPGRGFFDLTRFVHTSTIVYRYQSFNDLRFQEELFLGQDLVFFLALAKRSRRIVFSEKEECVTTHGIHIREGSGWDTPRAIWCLRHDMKCRKWLAKSGLLEKEEIGENKRQINERRWEFILNLLHELKNGRAFRNSDIVGFLKSDPAVLCYLGPVTFWAIAKKVGRN